jgi:hypothetical protein
MPELANPPTRDASGRGAFLELATELLCEGLAELEVAWIAIVVAACVVLGYAVWKAVGGNKPEGNDLVTLFGARR